MARNPNRSHLNVIPGGKSGLSAPEIYAAMQAEKKRQEKLAQHRAAQPDNSNRIKQSLNTMSESEAADLGIPSAHTATRVTRSQASRAQYQQEMRSLDDRKKALKIVAAASVALIAGGVFAGNASNDHKVEAAEALLPDPDQTLLVIGQHALAGSKSTDELVQKTRTVTIKFGTNRANSADGLHNAINAAPQTADDPALQQRIAWTLAGATELNGLKTSEEQQETYAIAMDSTDTEGRRNRAIQNLNAELSAALETQVVHTGEVRVPTDNQ
jgi:hypothetical protein